LRKVEGSNKKASAALAKVKFEGLPAVAFVLPVLLHWPQAAASGKTTTCPTAKANG
jgi:hypothetical protein